jgi:PPOX class probable F420-dependent enzyme
VVVTFAVFSDDVVVSAVDAKPKSTTDLQRLRNIAVTPAASLLVDHYDEDWTRLWWVRVDGTAAVVRDEPTRTELVAPLVAKYAQYRREPPRGPVVALTVRRTTSWAASVALRR